MIDNKPTEPRGYEGEVQRPEKLLLRPVENGAGGGIGCAAIVAALMYWDHSGKTAEPGRKDERT